MSYRKPLTEQEKKAAKRSADDFHFAVDPETGRVSLIFNWGDKDPVMVSLNQKEARALYQSLKKHYE